MKFLKSIMVMLLFAVCLSLLTPLANAATAWTSDTSAGQPGTVNVFTSSATSLVTETAVLTGLDLCSEIVIAIDGESAVTPTIVFAPISGGVSITAIASDVVAAAGSQTVVNYGLEALQITAADTTASETISYIVKEYLHKNCRRKHNM